MIPAPSTPTSTTWTQPGLQITEHTLPVPLDHADPSGPRIELFARQATPGWDVWGNEVASDIQLAERS